MNSQYALLLPKPFGDNLLEALLFGIFSIHLLFVLLMLGTAMIAIFFFVHSWVTGYQFELRWDKKILRNHLAFKSLAVVLGVGPLLVIQVLWSVPFFNAVSFLAPYWLALNIMMIAAFLSIDTLGQKIETHPVLHLIFGLTGVAVLLAIPLIFSGVLTIAEHSEHWQQLAESGFNGIGKLKFHWLVRYLHILGAAAVVGGVFHYFYSIKKGEERHYHLARWAIIALMIQIVLGFMLALTVSDKLSGTILTVLLIGVAASVLFLGLTYFFSEKIHTGRMGFAAVLLPVILLSMLMSRQMLQHQAIAPVETGLEQRAAAQKTALSRFQGSSLAAFKEKLATVYDNGTTIYQNACAFCHGLDGNGRGQSADALRIIPERLNAVRADRNYIYDKILHGIPGSGMPYFGIYDKAKLESLLDYLNDQFHMFTPEAQTNVSPDALQAARKVYRETCITCHGERGGISKFGKTLTPEPPDFRQYGLTFDYALQIINIGYPGTAMMPFNTLPDKTKKGLAALISSFKGS